MSESGRARRITTPGAVALGVGSMVGAGIFALMGEAAALAGSAVWLAFGLAGVIALLTGHSFVQLGIRYPSRGGVVEYLAQAYGMGRFSGACSILFYISQLIGMAMISLAFGKFAARLVGIEGELPFWERVFGSGLILGLSALALVGTRVVGQLQRKVVLANLILLAGFALALAGHADPARLSPETWPAGTPVLSSLALTAATFESFTIDHTRSRREEGSAPPTADCAAERRTPELRGSRVVVASRGATGRSWRDPPLRNGAREGTPGCRAPPRARHR